MKSEELRKQLRRKLTVMLIPHSNIRPIQLHLSISLLVGLAVAWTGLTLWSGYIASRHVDYWQTKTDEQVMRAKVWYYAQQIKKSREYLDRVRETELALQNLLNMKTRKAIVTSEDKAMGGAARVDQVQLAALLQGHPANMSMDDMRSQFDVMHQEGANVLENYKEISEFIKDQHELYRATPLSWPTQGRLTSYFGVRKFPLDRADAEAHEFHRGLDIANSKGTPVRATADGVIRIASWQGGYGRLVIIDHKRGYRTYYAHNSELLVKVGDPIKRGDVIAYMGTSGMSTGYHLHYEVWHNGRALNPLKFVKADDVVQH